MQTLADFQKTKDYLVCVDSDGCAMDTMDIKHIACFGPCMVTEWSLDAWHDAILARWIRCKPRLPPAKSPTSICTLPARTPSRTLKRVRIW